MTRPLTHLRWPLGYLVFALFGCAADVGLTEMDDETWFRRESRNALYSEDPSERTLQFLRMEALSETFENDPDTVLASLCQRLIATGDRKLAFHLAELCYLRGLGADTSEVALSSFLSATECAYAFLFDPGLGDPADPYDPLFRWACDFYNRSLALAAKHFRELPRVPGHPTAVRTLRGPMELYPGVDDYGWGVDGYDDSMVAFNYEVRGIDGYARGYGVGVPLIVVRAALPEGLTFRPSLLGDLNADGAGQVEVSQSFAATLVLNIPTPIRDAPADRPRIATLDIYSANRRKSVKIADRIIPLEVDLTSPLAHTLEQMEEGYSPWSAFLNADEYAGTAGLSMLEPYDPDKIPVVLVHGLLSSPNTWTYLINELESDPILRARYQVWFFRYPTGNPILLSAALLRQTLREVHSTLDPDGSSKPMQNMVICGHSMGGLLTKLQVLDGGDRLASELIEGPIEELGLQDDQLQFLREVLYFERAPFVGRVVFMAVPHRGSDHAVGFLGWLGSALVSVPSKVVGITASVASAITDRVRMTMGAEVEGDFVTSGVSGLAPTSLVATKISEWEFPEDLVIHSIIGDEDQAGISGGSDGFVPYSSSHLDSADSEIIIHSGHSVQERPEAVKELRRILREHLETVGPRREPPAPTAKE